MFFALAALCLAGCVTPITATDQAPQVAYNVSNRTLVAVVDHRQRVAEGRPEAFLGYARSMGIPSSWTVKEIMVGNPDDKDKTMAELLTARVVTGMSAAGGPVEAIVLEAPASDSAASDLLQQRGATNLLTLEVKDWHFDINLSWVGRFQFNSDADVTVQRAGAGTVLREHFAEQQAIQAEGDQSWANMVVMAYRAKLEQIVNDPDVRTALTAPVAPPAEAAVAATPTN
jgi:hypothetical protein